MRVKDVIGSPKANVVVDAWQSGPMPKSMFPMSRSGKHYMNFRGGYEWCCIRFETLTCEFRLVVAVNHSKQEFAAHLGMVCEKEMRMLASYEFHGTHPGWHVHAGCGDVYSIPVGRFMGPWKRRIPRDPKAVRRKTWNVTKANALQTACAAFGIPNVPQSEDTGQMNLI